MEGECTDELDVVGDHVPLDHMPTTDIPALSVDDLTGTTMQGECFEFYLFEDRLYLDSLFRNLEIESLETRLKRMRTCLYLFDRRYLLTEFWFETFDDLEILLVGAEFFLARISKYERKDIHSDK
jgi:thiaminase